MTFAAGTDIAAAGVELTDRIVAVLDLPDISERLVGETVNVILGRELFDSGRFHLDIESLSDDDRLPGQSNLVAEHRPGEMSASCPRRPLRAR